MTSDHNLLLKAFEQYRQLYNIQSILHWDESVLMPKGGANDRNLSLSLLEELRYATINNRDVAHALEAIDRSELSKKEQRNIDLMLKTYHQSANIPEKLKSDITKNNASCEQAWREFKPNNDWEQFKPHFNKLVQLHKELANRRAETTGTSPYDILIDDNNPDITQAIIDPIFSELKTELPTLIKHKTTQQAPLKSIPHRYPIAQQKQLAHQIMASMGFDDNKGLLGTSDHPFCIELPNDTRLTTRYNEHNLLESMTCVFHETGHALYEQHLPKATQYQPIGLAYGSTVHESQSIFMERFICTSLPYLEHLTPKINQLFNTELYAQDLYQQLHYVRPTLLRLDADMTTYPLHICLRYEIEQALFADKVTVDDLPELWDEKMQAYLGLPTKNNYKDGIMQDVHWASGYFGYFPSYTLGMLLAAQLYKNLQKDLPTLSAELKSGNFKQINQWLITKIHSHASSLPFDELVNQAVHSSLNSTAYLDFINDNNTQ